MDIRAYVPVGMRRLLPRVEWERLERLTEEKGNFPELLQEPESSSCLRVRDVRQRSIAAKIMELQEHEFFMRAAMEEARKAAKIGEVPIGAVVVRHGEIVGRGYNLRETEKDPTMHAEMIAIREASARLGGWRLIGCTLYVTLEPCPMCAGALVQSRVEQVVFGASDPKAGCAGTLMNLLDEPRFNHQVPVTGGVLAEECGQLLKDFFRRLRKPRQPDLEA